MAKGCLYILAALGGVVACGVCFILALALLAAFVEKPKKEEAARAVATPTPAKR